MAYKKTNKTPTERARKLYNTSVIFPFKVEFAKKVNDRKKSEMDIHRMLIRYHKRCSNNREFFFRRH